MASNLSLAAAAPAAPAAPLPPLSVSAQVGVAILALALALGLPGNLFVVWSVFCQVKKRSVTCVLVLHLALADAFVLLSAPLFLRYLLARMHWEFGPATCKAVHYLSSVNMYVSIYLICLMSMDRWLAVSRPFLSQRMRTKRCLLHLLLAVWVLAFLLSLPMPFYRSVRRIPMHNATVDACVPHHWKSVGHAAFQYLLETLMSCVLPFTLINACYASVMCRLKSAMFQRRGRGCRLILMIICAFVVFWLPYHVVNVMEVLSLSPFFPAQANVVLAILRRLTPTFDPSQVVGLLQGNRPLVAAARRARPNVTAFAFFSSAVNPVLYVFAGSSHIREAGLRFMGRMFEATNSESRSNSTFARGRGSTAGDDAGGALRAISLKMVRPFRNKGKERSASEAGRAAQPLAGGE